MISQAVLTKSRNAVKKHTTVIGLGILFTPHCKSQKFAPPHGIAYAPAAAGFPGATRMIFFQI